MATDVEICSRALLMLGDKPINSLTPGLEGNADRVRLAGTLFPQVRDDLLRAHPWNCAVKREQLPADGTTPNFDFPFRFLLPADWLRTLQVGRRRDRVDFKHEGRYLLSTLAPLPIVYVFQNTDVPTWDSALVHVCTLRMAAAMAYAITQSASMAEKMDADAEMAFKRAKAVDGQDEPPQDIDDYPFYEARLTGNLPYRTGR